MIPNNNLGPLAFYDSLSKQTHRRDYAFGEKYPLITPNKQVLPFQIRRDTLGAQEGEYEEYSTSAQHLWLNRSKAVTYGDATYYAYANYSNDNIYVAKYDHSTGTVTQSDTGFNTQDSHDAHASPVLYINSSGYIYVVRPAGGSTGDLDVFRSTNSGGDITGGWGSAYVIHAYSSGVIERFTYPHLMQLSDGTFVCNYRCFVGGSGKEGRMYVCTSSDAQTWNTPVLIMQGDVSPPGTTWSYQYADSFIDENDRFHLVYHAYEDPANLRNHNIYYQYSDNIDNASPTFEAIDSSSVSIPMWKDGNALVFDSLTPGWDTCYLTGFTLNEDNEPLIVAELLDSSMTDTLISFKWSGSSWESNIIEEDNEMGYGSLYSLVFARAPSDGAVTFFDGRYYVAHLFVEDNGTTDVTTIREWYSTDGVTWTLNATFIPDGTDNLTVPCYPENVTEACRLVALVGDLDYDAGHNIAFISISNALTVTLKSLDGSVTSSITSQMVATGLEVTAYPDQGYDIIKYKGDADMSLTTAEGAYYIEVTDGTNTWYSEVFMIVNDESNHLRIEYYCEDDIQYTDGVIEFTDDFKFVLYLPAQLGRPEYPFEETVTTRDGYQFPEIQISNKTFKFNFYAPEFLLDAMRLIRMMDHVTITNKGDEYQVDTFLVGPPNWQDGGVFAAVEAEFQCDTVVKKIGKVT